MRIEVNHGTYFWYLEYSTSNTAFNFCHNLLLEEELIIIPCIVNFNEPGVVYNEEDRGILCWCLLEKHQNNNPLIFLVGNSFVEKRRIKEKTSDPDREIKIFKG